MAWKDTLLDSSFRGVPFQCERIGRSGQRAIGTHEFPYRAGAELEDMSLGPRAVRMRAYFFGDDYEDQLSKFIDALEAPGTAELVHPIHGSMTMLAQGWEDEHDAELVDGAVVNVSFVEDALRTLVFSDRSTSSKVDAISAAADSARGAADNALAGVMGGLKGAVGGLSLGGLAGSLGLPALSSLAGLSGLPSLSGLGNIAGLAGIGGVSGLLSGVRGAFDQAKSFLGGGLLSISGVTGMVLSNLDPILHPRAYASDLLSMIDRGFQGFSFGGRNRTYTAPVMLTVGAVAVAATTQKVAVSSSVAVMSDFAVVRSQLAPSTLAISSPEPAAAAPALAACLAVVQAHAQVHLVAAIAESVAIVLAAEPETPVLDRVDIEKLTGQARADIQVAIDAARTTLDAESSGQTSAALGALALAVQEAARAIINQRPPLTQRASPVGGPVRLVAHAMYGNPDRAADLLSLNRLGRRMLIEKGETLYAYSR